MRLRDYQVEISSNAVNSLNQQQIAYLAMEVRTGKTLTALETANKFGAKRVLFVSKKKALSSIQSDYEMLAPKYELSLINFESLHKVKELFDLIIIDEAHSIGAFPKPSKRTKDLKKICKGLPIIFLSGTPSPESYSQLYHQLWVSDFSPWKEYPTFYKWAKAFVDIQQKRINGFSINDYTQANETKIKPYIDSFLFTYTQSQAGFKQSLREETILVKMDAKTYDAIEQIKKDRITTIDNSDILADTPAKLLIKLHQLSSGTVIDEKDTPHIFDRSKANIIVNRFAEQKIAIFYVFRSEFEMLKDAFPKWTDSPEEFQSSTDKVFLGQFRSAREGVKLDSADALIFFNIEFSFLSYEQAKNRLQSKDREKEAILYFVFSDCGIEQYVYDAVCNKKDFTLSYYGRARK